MENEPKKDEWWIIEHIETGNRQAVFILRQRDSIHGLGYLFVGSNYVGTDSSDIRFVRKVEMNDD